MSPNAQNSKGETAKLDSTPLQDYFKREIKDPWIKGEIQKYSSKGNDILADRWINGLNGDKLRPVAKALGKVISATTYSGESSPTFFAAWKESIYSML